MLPRTSGTGSLSPSPSSRSDNSETSSRRRAVGSLSPGGVPWAPGDRCATTWLTVMRAGPSLTSRHLAEIPAGVPLVVVELGEDRRVRVATLPAGEGSSSRQHTKHWEGWISVTTPSGYHLVNKFLDP